MRNVNIFIVMVLVSVVSTAHSTLYWVGNDGIFFDESNWSTVTNDASQIPPDGTVNTDPATVTDDMVIRSTYDGSATTSPAGDDDMSATYYDYMTGISALKMSGCSLTLDTHTMRLDRYEGIFGDDQASQTVNLENGAKIGAVAIRDLQMNLHDTSQARYWGTGSAIFTGSTINFASDDASLLLWNMRYGVDDISDQLAKAAGFQYKGASITTDDLVMSQASVGYGDGGTLIQAIPEPVSFGLIALAGFLYLFRRIRR